MSKKATAPVTNKVIPTPTNNIVVATTIPTAPAIKNNITSSNITNKPKSEAETLFNEVMAESGEQLMAEVHAYIEANGLQLTPEESAAIKEQADAAFTEAARIRNLTPEEYEAEFGMQFLDGVSIAEQTIQKSNHVHKDRIFGLLQKIRELYVG